jgi:hypothetical protein
MAVTIYNRAKYNWLNAYASKPLYALILNTYTPNPDHHTVSDVSGTEIAGNGYARTALGSIAASQDDTNDWGKLTAANIAFGAVGPGGGQAITHLVVYDNTNGTDATRDLVAVYDCSATLNGGTFTANINANGLLTIG